MSKETLIVGATEKSTRYAYFAGERLLSSGHPIKLVAKKEGEFKGIKIHAGYPKFEGVHTVTMYVGPQNQSEDLMDYILTDIAPKRIIFNPGTENPEFEKRAESKNIEALRACTLVMLSTGLY